MHAGATAKIFQLAEKLRNNITLPEKKLWEFLKLKPEGFKFRRQHPFAVYILDFYCHKKQLSMEIDGSSHDSTEQKLMDNHRTQLLEESGINEIRFTNDEVTYEFQSVVEIITTYLQDGSL